MIGRESVLDIGRRALRGWIDDGGSTLGAAVAFYALLTLAPLLLVAVGVGGFFVGGEEAQLALVTRVAALLGDGAALGVESFLDAAGRGGVTPALVGAVAMILGAVTIFAALRAGLDRIWKAPPRAAPPWRDLAASAAAFVLVTGAGLLLVASMLASTFLAAARPQALAGAPWALHGLEFLVSFVAMTALFALLFKVLPTPKVEWRDVALGAAATSLLFWIGKFAVAHYLGKAALDSGFGAAGAGVVIAAWAWYSAQAFFLGAEVTRHYALRLGSRRDEVPVAPTLAEMNAAYEELIERTRRRTSQSHGA